MSDNQSTFQNEHLSVATSQEPNCLIKAEVTVTPKGLQAARHAAIKVINKEVSVPGFRKGKAPESMIVDRFKSHIDKEWQQQASRLAFFEMIELTGIRPLNRDNIQATVDSFSPETGAKITYKFEVNPSVPLINPQELVIPEMPPHQVSETDVSNYLEQLRQQDVKWEPITDRASQDDDYLDVEVTQLGENGEEIEIPNNSDKNVRTRISSDRTKMDEWIYKLLNGLTIGQTVEGLSESPKETECHACESGEVHTHETPPQRRFRFTLHGINKAILPEVTDEFAKKLGADDVEDLKKKIMISLTHSAKEQLHNTMREQTKRLIVEKYPFEIPGSMVRSQIDANLEHIKKIFVNIPQEVQNQEFAKIVEKITHDLNFYLLISHFAHAQGINISEELIDSELTREMWYKAMGRNTHNLPDDPKEARSQIQQHLMIKEVLDNVIKNAQIRVAHQENQTIEVDHDTAQT